MSGELMPLAFGSRRPRAVWFAALGVALWAAGAIFSAQASPIDPDAQGSAFETPADPAATDGMAPSGPAGAGPAAPQNKAAPGSDDKKKSSPERDFTVKVSGDLTEVYTDNAFGTAGNGKSDIDTQVGVDIQLHDKSNRFTGDLSNGLSGNVYAVYPQLDGVTDYLNATAKAELVEKMLLVDAQAFATPVSLSTVGALSGGQRTIPSDLSGGYGNGFGYSIEPDLKNRLGEFAESEFTVTQSSAFISSPIGPTSTSVPVSSALAAPADTSSTVVAERLSNGTMFSSVHWTLAGSDSEYYGAQRFSDRLGTAEVDYIFSREFSVLGTGGYEDFSGTGDQTGKLNGPVGTLGVHLSFGKELDLTLRAGWQYGDKTITGDLRYALTPTAHVSASLIDDVSTPGQRLIQSLQTLGTQQSAEGSPSISTFSPLPLDQLLINNSIARYRTLTVSVTESTERTSLGLTGFGTIEDALDNPVLLIGAATRSTSVGIQFSGQHNLTRNTTASLTAGYTVQRQFGFIDKVIQADASVRYNLSSDMSIETRATYLARIESASTFGLLFTGGNSQSFGTLHDIEFSAGIRRSF